MTAENSKMVLLYATIFDSYKIRIKAQSICINFLSLYNNWTTEETKKVQIPSQMCAKAIKRPPLCRVQTYILLTDK